MLTSSQERFNITIYAPTVMLLYVSKRRYVLASTWPHFTLLGQSIGSMILAYDAFSLLVPDIFIDTMGYAFALGLCKFLFPSVPTGAYVHYPTISTDMLQSLNAERSSGRGLNAGAGKGLRGQAKSIYWHAFAGLYGWVGGKIDVVMTNSSWTQGHINKLWGWSRSWERKIHKPEIVYPPCAVEDLTRAIKIDLKSEKQREHKLIYIAQFRPEKNHQLVLRAFAQYLKLKQSMPRSGSSQTIEDARLTLIGSVRDSTDETYIYSLRLLAHELHITTSVTFLLNASWPSVLSEFQTASVGINAMWNEHFGIGVVEYQAAGLICVINDSGGPKNDIVIDTEGGATGYHASTEAEYATAFSTALALPAKDALSMRLRARENAKRFGNAQFDESWIKSMDILIDSAWET